MDFGLNMRMGISKFGVNTLQEIIFDRLIQNFIDKKGNMNPVLNQIPVVIFGVDDYLDTLIPANTITAIECYQSVDNAVSVYNGAGAASNNDSLLWGTNLNNTQFLATFGSGVSSTISGVSTGWNKHNLSIVGDVLSYSINDGTAVTATKQPAENITTNTLYLGARNLGTAQSLWNGKASYCKITHTGGVSIFVLGNFMGDKCYDLNGLFTAQWYGTGQRFTRADDIVDLWQHYGCKIVIADEGTGYFPTTTSNTVLNVAFTNATISEVSQDGKTIINDGSELDLHPTISDLIADVVSEIIKTGFDNDLGGFVEDNSNAIINNNVVEITTTAGYGSIKKTFPVESGKRYHVKSIIKTEAGGQYRIRIDATSLAIFSKVGSDTEYIQTNDSFIADGTGTATIWIQNVMSSKTTFCDFIEIDEIITLSDYLNNIETESGINLNEYVGGDVLPNKYKSLVEIGKFTKSIKLLKP